MKDKVSEISSYIIAFLAAILIIFGGGTLLIYLIFTFPIILKTILIISGIFLFFRMFF